MPVRVRVAVLGPLGVGRTVGLGHSLCALMDNHGFHHNGW